ncbi:MAG: hypothetical protein ACKVP3_20105 [Hyphomicrobiaceae bacterium]
MNLRALWEKIATMLGSSTGAATDRRLPDPRRTPGLAGHLWRILVNIVALVIALSILVHIFRAPLPGPSAAYTVILVAACLSTAAAAFILLSEASADKGQRAGRERAHDTRRFWLSAFALISGILMLSEFLGRLPAHLDPPWLNQPPPRTMRCDCPVTPSTGGNKGKTVAMEGCICR